MSPHARTGGVALRARPVRRWMTVGSLTAVAVITAACSSSASAPTSTVLKPKTTSAKAAGTTVSTASAGPLGTILVDQAGFTLYRFTPDGTGKTTCTGGCATEWPPVTTSSPHVTAGTGVMASELGTITRPDGSLQVTFNGMALYRFSGDAKAGDTMGQGVAGVWFVVPASGASTPPTSSSTPTSAPPAASTAPATPPATSHAVMPQNTGSGTPAAPAPAATAPPVTAPPPTSPPMTSPPPTSPPSPPTTQGGGYGY